ncbi:Set1 complex component swd1 [Babesia caballi]|uniref:Set1 complex component swd1 n=1 Tax=Babesia caballi TaxID=5871 RepID=A0AAV4LQD5_BABCB|nr:Set1 complex component swd1 [Babesia caballi]
MAAQLPIKIYHRSDPEYACMAVSTDGNTIALGTDETISLVPTASPSLPSAKLIFETSWDTYSEDMQRYACSGGGRCESSKAFAEEMRRRYPEPRGIVHIAFYGSDNEYLMALGRESIAVYDLFEVDAHPIITVALRYQLDTNRKVCFYPLNVERGTVTARGTAVCGLSGLEFIINDRKKEINYYKIVFCEREKWWYVDCDTTVNLLSNIEHAGVETCIEPSPFEAQENGSHVKTNARSLPAQTAKLAVKQNGTANGSSSVPTENCQGDDSVRGAAGKLGCDAYKGATPDDVIQSSVESQSGDQTDCNDEGSSGSNSSTCSPGVEDVHRIADPDNEGNQEDGGTNESDASDLQVHEQGKTVTNADGLLNSGEADGREAIAPGMESEIVERKNMEHNFKTDKLGGKIPGYKVANGGGAATTESCARNATDASNGVIYRGDSGNKTKSKVRFTESQRIYAESDVSKGSVSYKQVAATLPSQLLDDMPFMDLEVEAEKRMEKSQVPIPHEYPGETFVAFSVLLVSMPNSEVSRKVVNDYPFMDDVQLVKEALDDECVEMKGKRIRVDYTRELFVVTAYEFGYIDLFKIGIKYNTQVMLPEGNILQVEGKKPRVEMISRLRLYCPLAVESIVNSETNRGYFAVLGRDAFVLLYCPLAEWRYNFDDATVQNDMVNISCVPQSSGLEIQTVLRHHEVASNSSVWKIGCFGYSRGECLFVTNSYSGLKIYDVEKLHSSRFLKVAMRFSMYFTLKDVLWIPHSTKLALLNKDGQLALMQPTQSTHWSTLIPNFCSIESNVEYVEKEGEFDVNGAVAEVAMERKVNYDKLEGRAVYKFFYTVQYAMCGYSGFSTSGEPEFDGASTVHSEGILVEYYRRLTLQ